MIRIPRTYIPAQYEKLLLSREFVAVWGLLLVLLIVYTLSKLFGGKKKVFSDPEMWVSLKLIKKEEISHDTRRFTFALPTKEHILGLPIGQHISFKYADSEGNVAIRSYTPTTGDEVAGTVTFVIKVYFAGVVDRFPNGGVMSQHLNSLSVGDSMMMRGPKGTMNYSSKQFTIKGTSKKPMETRQVKEIAMIAGGTGITPMLQIIKRVLLLDPNDKTTKVSLLYANVTENDILCREELELLAKEYKDRFSLHYTLDKPPSGWKYSSGFINYEMIEENLPAPSADKCTQVMLCGPPPMIKFACLPNLEKRGYGESEIFVF
jgi:cytochrome-b5 reductase